MSRDPACNAMMQISGEAWLGADARPVDLESMTGRGEHHEDGAIYERDPENP